MFITRKRIFLLIILLIIVVVFILLFNINKPKVVDINVGRGISNVNNYQVVDGDIYYFTGSAFAKIDTKNGSVSRLSDYLLIKSNVGSFKYYSDGVIFKSFRSSDDDISKIKSDISDSRASNWWFYSFKNKRYELINFGDIDNCVDLYKKEDTFVCISEKNGNSQNRGVLLYKNNTTINTGISGYIDRLYIDNKFIYYEKTNLDESSGLYRYSPDNHRNSLIYKSRENIIDYLINKDRAYVLIDKSNRIENKDTHNTIQKNQDIVVLSLDNKFSEVKNKSINGSLGEINITNGLVYFINRDGFYVDIDSDKTSIYRIAGAASPEDVFLINSRLFLINSSGVLYLSKNNIKKDELYRTPDSFDVEGDNIEGSNIWIEEAGKNKFRVYLYDNKVSFSGNANKVDYILARDYFNPLEFNIDWDLNSSNRSVLVSPSYTIYGNE